MAELDMIVVDEKIDDGVAPVEWLDYDFIEQCEDFAKLKVVVKTLKSGKEGYFPDVSC